ncbi:L,D-transpeptidase family protein [Roseicitreum antarcticum]|uniref:Murein L,D-transpeptidase YcbB/YkuD n=1 Tax=Roseicitreum antarcticum TaxID=564137 RepID=A0A1H2TW44_9RHOB|nr:L,D-transpeptidase family protein [Roseicitreum antarcticum]SDW47928.1 Murein L,D-transpeptidase YcbB/YkuD [Roseicitreum antarcticum]
MIPQAVDIRQATSKRQTGLHSLMVGMVLFIGLFMSSVSMAGAQTFSAFKQAVAEGAAGDTAVSAFYRETGYDSLWTGPDDAVRRSAFLTAIRRADDHGLPVARYAPDALIAAFSRVETERDRGLLEAEVTRQFLRFANDLHSGLLDPSRIDSAIVRELPRLDALAALHDFAEAAPMQYMRGLAPGAPEYARLFRAKQQLEARIAQGGWGPAVPARDLRPGQSGGAVVALRNRLIAMEYLPRSASASYDGALQRAVQQFQIAHNFEADGIAGPETLAAINTDPSERLKAIIVAMERERWLNIPRGDRHVWVNLTDFHARIVDFDSVTFETKAVIGATGQNRETPEFSHRMQYLEINPDWTMPRSILARSYWNGLAAGGHSYLQLVDSRGNVVPRAAVDFSRYSPRNFPFNVRQPPGPSNPLGRVKFMFPNPYAIYLHDSPARSLFNTTVRAHSSGCVRLNDPDEFAYELLSRQTDDPRGLYHNTLNSGQQTRIYLDEPVQIHLVYRTAFTSVRGEMNYRADVYGRDAAIFRALQAAGVVLGGIQS